MDSTEESYPAFHGVLLDVTEDSGFAYMKALVLDEHLAGDMVIPTQIPDLQWRSESPTDAGGSKEKTGFADKTRIDGSKDSISCSLSSLPVDSKYSSSNSIDIVSGDTEVGLCLLTGLPHGITKEALSSFLEPYGRDIRGFHILQQNNLIQKAAEYPKDNAMHAPLENGTMQTEPRTLASASASSEQSPTRTMTTVRTSACAIIEFSTPSITLSFAALYNNLHFPYSLQHGDAFKGDGDSDSDGSMQVPILAITLRWVRLDIPTNHSYTLLPLCALCLRRLNVRFTAVRGAGEIPVSLRYGDNRESCHTCAIYGHYLRHGDEVKNEQDSQVLSSDTASATTPTVTTDSVTPSGELNDRSDSRSRTEAVGENANSRAKKLQIELAARKMLPWRCTARDIGHEESCGLAENIWVCLVCGHTGCGRYANQHAKQHGTSSGHTFSLELVSGRIWAYKWDTFVHTEGLPFEHLDGGNREVESRSLRQALRDTAVAEGENERRLSNNEDTTPYKRAAAGGGTGAATFGNIQGNFGSPSGHGPPMISLRGLRQNNSRSNSSSGLPDTVSAKMHAVTKDYEDLLESQLGEQRLFFEKELARETVRALERVYTGSANSVVSQGQSECGDNTNTIFAEIEEKKISTSIMEQRQQELLAQVRTVESDIRDTKKQNDRLIRSLKSLRKSDEEIVLRTKQLEQRLREQEEEMKQTMRDLGFFLDTRGRIGESETGLQNEIKEGKLEIRATEPSPSPTKSKTSKKEMK